MARNEAVPKRLRTSTTARLSPAGRKACAVAGNANLTRWREQQEVTPDVRGEVEKFERELLGDLGENVNAARRGLATSAAASYGVILAARNKLLGARRWRHGTDSLIDLLGRAQGSFLRSLRGLGVDLHGVGDDPDAPPRSALADYLASKATRTEGNTDDGNG